MANLSTRRLCFYGPLLLLALLTGCAREPAIRTYTVSRDIPDRLLGGILLQEDRGWFFKLSGPRQELDAKTDEFKTFLKSLQINSDSTQPEWTLPDGWEVDTEPHQMRVATIKVPLKSKTAELTVTVLPRPPQSGDDAQYLLANINRWRDQMGQGRISARDLESLEKVEAQGAEVYLVNITGRMKAGSMTAPFAGGS